MLPRTLLFALPLALLVFQAEARAADEHPIVTLVKSKVRDKDKAFGITVTFKVKAGSEQAFEDAFKPCVVATRKEPGCLAYYLNRDVDDPDTFVAFEEYKNIVAFEDHARSPHVVELLKTLAPLLEGLPDVKVSSIAGE